MRYGRVGKSRFRSSLCPRAGKGDGFECVPAPRKRGGLCGRGAVPRGLGVTPASLGWPCRAWGQQQAPLRWPCPGRSLLRLRDLGQRWAGASRQQCRVVARGRATAAAGSARRTWGARGGPGTAARTPGASFPMALTPLATVRAAVGRP